MKLYVRAVRHWWAVPVALLLLAAVCWMLGGTEVPVPRFLGGTVSMRVQYFTPLLVVGAVLYCLERRLDAPENTAVVRVDLLDRGCVTASVVSCHALGLIVGMDVPRNLMVLLAVALVVRRVGNEAAAGAACLLLLLLSAGLGRTFRPSGEPAAAWWALTLHAPGSLPAWFAALVLFGLGLLVSAGRRGPRPIGGGSVRGVLG